MNRLLDRALRMAPTALVATVPMMLLASSPGPARLEAETIVAAGALGSVALRLVGRSRLRPLEGLPFLAALFAATLLVAVTPLTELLAGFAALGVLIWVAQDLAWPSPILRSARGLALPGLALVLAFGIAFGLPVARQSVGIAAVLVVVSLGALGWALAAPTRLREPSVS